jgi:hypothetical protein
MRKAEKRKQTISALLILESGSLQMNQPKNAPADLNRSEISRPSAALPQDLDLWIAENFDAFKISSMSKKSNN